MAANGSCFSGEGEGIADVRGDLAPAQWDLPCLPRDDWTPMKDVMVMAVRRRAFEYFEFHGRVFCFQQKHFVAMQRLRVWVLMRPKGTVSTVEGAGRLFSGS